MLQAMTMESTNKKLSSIFMAKFDIRASLNLIREAVLPISWLASRQHIRVSEKAAGDASLRVKDAIRLLVEIGRHDAKAILEVVPKLAIKITLSRARIDIEISKPGTKGQYIILRSARAVAIVASFENEDSV